MIYKAKSKVIACLLLDRPIGYPICEGWARWSLKSHTLNKLPVVKHIRRSVIET